MEKSSFYEEQLDELEEGLQVLISELDSEETISFEQHQQYQSTLDKSIRELNTLSQEVDATSPTIQTNFTNLLKLQEKIVKIDVEWL